MEKFLDKKIIKIISLFLLLGPIFDLLSSINKNVIHMSFNFIMIFKMLFLIILIYYLLFISKSKYKKKSIIILSSIIIYIFIFLFISITTKDISVLSYEASNMFRAFFFPISLICIFNIFIEKENKIDYKFLSLVLVIYVLLIIIPYITKTGFETYAYSKVGTVGWFNSANEISAILSILSPIFLVYILSLKNKLKWLFLITIFSFYFTIGSKVPVISLLIIFSVYLIKYLVNLIRKKDIKKISIITFLAFVLICMSVLIIPKTNFYKNIKIHLDFLEVDSISDLMTFEKIDHFIFSSRLKFAKNTYSSYESSSIIEKLFGIGYIQNYGTDNVNTKVIEIDYLDILFRHGIIGFIIFFVPLIFCIKNQKKEKKDLSIYISLFLIFTLSLFSGHILVAPSVSIYVIIILLFRKKNLYD